MSKNATLVLLVLLALSSLVMVDSISAQSIPKPYVPEFAVDVVDSSYDVPTTYSIDPFTGENVTHEGYHVKSTSIQIEIMNQPFDSFWIQENPLAANWTVNFYYNIRMKGHFSEDWIELYNPSDGYVHQDSDSEYTVRTYTWGGDADTILGTKMIRIPAGGQVDFQVEAMIGYVHRDASTFWAPWVFEGEKSGWSNTQTITIPENQTPSLEGTPTPPNIGPTSRPREESMLTQRQLELVLGVAFTVAVVGAGLGLLLYLIKRRQSQ